MTPFGQPLRLWLVNTSPTDAESSQPGSSPYYLYPLRHTHYTSFLRLFFAGEDGQRERMLHYIKLETSGRHKHQTFSLCHNQHRPMEYESSMKAAVDTAVEHQVLHQYQIFILHNL